MAKKGKEKRITAWADIGSHGDIFEFMGGPVAERYPHLMHIFSRRLTDDLKPVTIIIKEKKEVN